MTSHLLVLYRVTFIQPSKLQHLSKSDQFVGLFASYRDKEVLNQLTANISNLGGKISPVSVLSA